MSGGGVGVGVGATYNVGVGVGLGFGYVPTEFATRKSIASASSRSANSQPAAPKRTGVGRSSRLRGGMSHLLMAGCSVAETESAVETAPAVVPSARSLDSHTVHILADTRS